MLVKKRKIKDYQNNVPERFSNFLSKKVYKIKFTLKVTEVRYLLRAMIQMRVKQKTDALNLKL